MRLPLACTVRSCAQPLEREGPRFVCPRGHSYDVARSGYVNLLQPQDRRSAEAGDSRGAVEARAALEAAGVGRALVDAVADLMPRRGLPSDAVLVDLGCGTGQALGRLCTSRDRLGIGIDLSVAATTRAARRWPALAWVVANADRRLPLLDRTVDAVVSLHARRNPGEAARVLKKSGLLVMAVPAADDLLELRTAVQGSGPPRDRVARLLAEHAGHFRLENRLRVEDRMTLGREPLLALLGATYRGARRSAAADVRALTSLEVTLASEVCVFRLR